MIIVDASNLSTGFDIDRLDDDMGFANFVSSSTTEYTYLTSFGHSVTLNGTGFSADANNGLISGAISSISIDLDNDGTTDINISNLPLLPGAGFFNAISNSPSTVIVNGVNIANSIAFWEIVSFGPTEIIQGNFEFDFYSDFISLRDQSETGSDDVFTNGADVDNGRLVGDAFTISGNSFLVGGNDTFDTADIIEADVRSVRDTSVLIGGDDNIILTVDFTVNEGSTPGGNIAAIGDAGTVEHDGFVEGGDDFIDLRVLSVASATSTGDVFTSRDNSVVIGGDDTIFGGANDDILRGDANAISDQASLTGGNDIIFGGDGADSIYGDYRTNTSTGMVTGGDDMLYGEAGNDEIFGNEGDDFLEGGAGGDVLDGGAGIDTASYATSTNRVIINLATNTATSGHATGDSFESIENIIGSQFADTITGSSGDNVITGGNGFDVLAGFSGDDHIIGGDGRDFMTGGAGADIIDGGASGADIARYVGSNEGVTINLATGTASGGHAEGDTLIDVEFLFGSSHDDSLTGDANNNWLFGSGGDDILDGGAGIDKFFGGTGADTFAFSSGDQFVFVTDFENDVDTIDLSSYGYANIDAALADMDQRGDHVRFFNNGDTLFLLNTDLEDLADDIDIGGGSSAKTSLPAIDDVLSLADEYFSEEAPNVDSHDAVSFESEWSFFEDSHMDII